MAKVTSSMCRQLHLTSAGIPAPNEERHMHDRRLLGKIACSSFCAEVVHNGKERFIISETDELTCKAGEDYINILYKSRNGTERNQNKLAST